ncbi:MAG: 4Fe-4S dicluster domain-containing protein [Anaerolineae bacterium]|nr:4Fe-4S dicluster domain-containing protein [Anaerolineae bacterium]
MSDSNIKQESDLTRRNFLRGLMGAAGAATAIAAYETFVNDPQMVLAQETAPVTDAPSVIASADGDHFDNLERMRMELLRALQKPTAERRWVMVIDLRKCVGCHACTISCVAENKLPPGVVYRPVLDEEWGTYPNVGRRFIPRPCMQCDNPPCTPVCPVNATFKNEEGIVEVDYDQCIGCRACLAACPYGARTADFGLTYTGPTPIAAGLVVGQDKAEGYERVANFEYGEARQREGHESPIGNARKCHFCLHRVHAGELPACVTTCIGRATMYGDANDANSLVAEMIASPNVIRLKEELGTEPRVYYLA